jgi:uncharacterized protein YggE
MRSSILIALPLVTATVLAPGAARADDAPRGSITIVGTGEATSAPEFTSVTVTVTSICYDTSRAAVEANAVLANKVLATLKKFATSTRDKVTATGGANVLETESTWDGSQFKTICTMKWKATNTLTIEMAAFSALPDLQDQTITATESATSVDPAHVAQTYAEIGRPVFNLYPETEQRLRGDADVKAYGDAHQQLVALATTCTFDHPELILIAPAEYTLIPRAAAASGDLSASTPVIPDEIAVQARLKFQWSFEPTSACAPAP